MRTAIFIIVILAIVGTSFYLKKKGIFFGDTKDYIAPQSQWSAILKSKWNLEYQNKSQDHDWAYSGVIDFLTDGSFSFKVTIKDLKMPPQRNVVGGGTIGGLYFLDDDSTFRISIVHCQVSSAFLNEGRRWDLCHIFEFNNAMFDGQEELDIVEFNSKKIRMIGKIYNNDAVLDYTFTKINP